ncbi:hypothetical protein SRHO_G00344350 [Serrasalmus rhombeus]
MQLRHPSTASGLTACHSDLSSITQTFNSGEYMIHEPLDADPAVNPAQSLLEETQPVQILKLCSDYICPLDDRAHIIRTHTDERWVVCRRRAFMYSNCSQIISFVDISSPG